MRLRAGALKPLVVLGLVLGLWQPQRAGACTTFCIRDGAEVVFGKNYDWNIGHGLVIVNKRNTAKTALLDNQDTPARWTSRYGSVTFNQFGREAPSGGVNEAGLAIELMWLNEARYPAADDRPAVGVLGWIQYQLDSHATVQQVLASGASLRISGSVPLHYLACDRSGECAAIEFLDGRLVAHSGAQLPARALANDPYRRSLEYLQRHHGSALAPGQDRSSLNRFAIAAQSVEAYRPAPGRSAVDYGFDVLERVAQGAYTQWSIVYDLQRPRVYFRTLQNRNVRSVDLTRLDFDCSSPVRVLDLDFDATGDVTDRFADYTAERNRDLIGRSFAGVDFLASVPAGALDAIARQPDSAMCQD
jgi:choloylglycine hydrolase